MDLALRSPAVAAVIADASGLDMASSRRLQLAAEAGLERGGGGLALLVRPPDEARELSAAATRWRVACVPATGRSARWSLELLRRKGGLGAAARGNGNAAWKGERALAGVEGGRGLQEVGGGGVGGWEGWGGWIVEMDRATGRVVVPADVVDRPGQAPVAAARADGWKHRRSA